MYSGPSDSETHAARFLALAEEVAPRLQSDGRARALDDLERNHPGLERALSWLVDQGDADRAARVVRLLAEFWWERGHIRDGRRWAARILALPELAAPTERRAALLDAAAGLATRDGDLAARCELHKEALAIRRGLGEPRPLAQSLVHLGVALVRSGDGSGWSLLEEALALSQEHGLGRYARHVQYQIARAALDGGDHRRAEALGQEIVRGLRGSPEEWAAGAIIELAAAAAAGAGQAERALRLAAAGEAQRLAVGMVEQGDFGPWLSHLLQPARQALSEAERARVRKAGRAMTRDQALADVLAE